jgi:hypothetical protein
MFDKQETLVVPELKKPSLGGETPVLKFQNVSAANSTQSVENEW